MALTNRQRVEKGFELLRDGLAPYVERELRSALGDGWMEQVPYRRGKGLEEEPDGTLRWDTKAVLKVMIDRWDEQFKQTLGHFERSLVGELLDTRNRWAHDEPFSSDDTLRALDSIGRLLQAVSASDQAKAVDEVKTELQRTVFAEQARQKTRQVTAVEVKPEAGLRPWREVVSPHPEGVDCARIAVSHAASTFAA